MVLLQGRLLIKFQLIQLQMYLIVKECLCIFRILFYKTAQLLLKQL